MWRPDVRMIEELARCREKIEPERALERASEQRVHDDGRQRAVRQDLHRMLVEGGQGLDARRRMVDLVEDNPEARKMANAVPPVEDERADKPADKSLQYRILERSPDETARRPTTGRARGGWSQR